MSKPINFSPDMAQAVWKGRKTQTRRVHKGEPTCPYGRHGDLLWAARSWLKITAVRLERLWDISEADAMAEGFESQGAFARKWRELYNDDPVRGWDSNPWVWIITFEKLEVTEWTRKR